MPRLSAAILLYCFLAIPATGAAEQQAGEKADGRDPAEQTGIDPTDIRTRIEAAYTYNDRANGTTRQNINLRLEREFTGRNLNVRLDVPYLSADIPEMSSQDGLGDVSVRINYRYRNTPGYSALVAGRVTLDSASDEALGDGTTKLTGIWVNSWRRRAWMLSAVTAATWSDSGEHDSAGVVPMAAYQPMKKYLSYLSLGLPVFRDLDEDETIVLALLRAGKVFPGGNVAYLGTRYDLSGNSDDDLVITVGYRYLF